MEQTDEVYDYILYNMQNRDFIFLPPVVKNDEEYDNFLQRKSNNLKNKGELYASYNGEDGELDDDELIFGQKV